MTQAERVALKISEDITPAEIEDCLLSAKNIIQSRRYPYQDFPQELESRYEDLQVRIAVELYNKAGAEGETSHSENGISRTYSSASVSPELLSEITPKGKVV